MSNVNFTRRDALGLAGLFATTVLAGCANGNTPPSASGSDEGSAVAADGTLITIAYKNTGFPHSYDDEQGNAAGYDIDMMKAIDDIMKDYSFKFESTTYDDVYMGLESGYYDGGLTCAFWTEERAEKYQIPEEPLGACVLTLCLRKENEGITNLEELSASGLQLAPIVAGNGIYYVVQQYNDEHPDAQVELRATEDSSGMVAGNFEELAAGKYDAIICPRSKYEMVLLAEDGESHDLVDQIVGYDFGLAYTYPMFRKDLDPAFVEAWSVACKEVKDSGLSSEFSVANYNYDIWTYASE